ncbi:MAG TPA: hypothetical protein VGS80_13680 [Ktedonobacterales bacterium]|nr:hypothetical protein [Ktedonobacterales bacterium]
MARILFVAAYYPPEIGAAQTQNRETAVRLARRGHDVTVLTTLPNYPTGIVPEAYRHRRRCRETIDGVKVVRVWSYTSANKGFLRRIVAMLSFGCLAGFLGRGPARRSARHKNAEQRHIATQRTLQPGVRPNVVVARH